MLQVQYSFFRKGIGLAFFGMPLLKSMYKYVQFYNNTMFYAISPPAGTQSLASKNAVTQAPSNTHVQPPNEKKGNDSQCMQDIILHHIEEKRQHCKKCTNCLSKDCGQCLFCKDKLKFGGPGKKKKCCIQRQCQLLQARGTIIITELCTVRVLCSDSYCNNSSYMHSFHCYI